MNLKHLSAPLLITQRGLHLRWWRTALTLVGIILGVAVILATQITNQTTIDSLHQIFDRATGKASLVVFPILQDGEYIPENLLTIINNTPGVITSAPIIEIRTLLKSEVPDWQIIFSMGGVAAGNMFILNGVDSEKDSLVRVYQLTEGRLPGEGRYEVVIPAEYAQENGLSINNYLELLSPEGYARLKIVGLLASEGVALLNNGVIGFAPLSIVQDIYDRGKQLDQIAIATETSISDDPRALNNLKNEISRRIGEKGDVEYPSGRGILVSQMLATYQLGLSLFSLLSIFVGAFLIYNTFSMTVAERSRELGMLRAVGMDKRQVMFSILLEAFLYALVGSFLGLIFGMILARGLIALVSGVVFTSDGLIRITRYEFFNSICVGIGVTLLSAYLPARRAGKVTPIEALRTRSRTQEHIHAMVWIGGLILMLSGYVIIYRLEWPEEIIFPVGSTAIFMILVGATLTVTLVYTLLERFVNPLVGWIYGNEGKVGSRNVQRSLSRTTLTVAALLVALTMIISISSVAFTFKKDIEGWIDSALGGDIYVRGAIPLRESFERNLENIPGVEVVTPTRGILVRADRSSLPDEILEDTFYYVAIDIASLRSIADFEFIANQGDVEQNWQRLEQGGSIFITNVTADRYDLNRGDYLKLYTRKGLKDFFIAGVVVDFTGQSGIIYGTYDDLHKLFGEQGVERFTIKVKEGYPIAQVTKTIKDRYQKTRNLSLQSTTDFKQSVLDLVDQSFRLFDVLSLIGVIIGGIGVVNTLAMNIIERQQEIGMLRSLGMTRIQTSRMVLAEALTLGLMGGLYGLVFGYFMARVMIYGMNIMVGFDLKYRFTMQPFIIGIVIAILISQLAAYLPAKRAANVNIVEAIKNE